MNDEDYEQDSLWFAVIDGIVSVIAIVAFIMWTATVLGYLWGAK